MLRLTLSAAAAVVLAMPYHRFDTPRIKRIETVNASNLQAPVTTPYVAPGQAKEYWIYGPWVDWADAVMLGGVPQTILEKKPLFNSDGALLRVRLKVPDGAARGQIDLAVHVNCTLAPFTDCATGNLTRKVQVLRVGTVSGISPNTGVVAGTPTPFTVSGTGMDVATIYAWRTTMTNTSIQSRTSTTLAFTGAPHCGSSTVVIRDMAEGGDFYPYSGVATVSSSTQCGYQPPPKTMTTGSCPVGQVWDPNTKTCKP